MLLAAAGVAESAPVTTTLDNFPAGNSGSYGPLVQDGSGALYGTLFNGGVTGTGAVFKLTPPAAGQTAWTQSIIWSFTNAADGGYPYAGLTRSPTGVLYGVTTHGGTNGGGTVFELTPPAAGQQAWTETTVWNLCAGCYPGSTNVFLNARTGVLYGTTETGGTFGRGIAFELRPPAPGSSAWTETTLWNFGGTAADGSEPANGVVADASGALYGTTLYGGITACPDGFGNTTSCGTVFKLTPPPRGQSAWTESVLYAFSGPADGYEPNAPLLLDAVGGVYGTTTHGGSGTCEFSYNGVLYNLGCGTVFKVAQGAPGTAASHSVIWNFTGYPGDGAQPYGGLIADTAGSLYGTTFAGGTYEGTVFKLYPPLPGSTQWNQVILSDLAAPGGYAASSTLLQSRGTLYGTTVAGGSNAGGTVFDVTGVNWNHHLPGALLGPPVTATRPSCIATTINYTNFGLNFANNCSYDVSFYACEAVVFPNYGPPGPGVCAFVGDYNLDGLAANATAFVPMGVPGGSIVYDVRECPANTTFPLGLISYFECVPY